MQKPLFITIYFYVYKSHSVIRKPHYNEFPKAFGFTVPPTRSMQKMIKIFILESVLQCDHCADSKKSESGIDHSPKAIKAIVMKDNLSSRLSPLTPRELQVLTTGAFLPRDRLLQFSAFSLQVSSS